MLGRYLGYATLPIAIFLIAFYVLWIAQQRADSLTFVGKCVHEIALREGFRGTSEKEWQLFSKICADKYGINSR